MSRKGYKCIAVSQHSEARLGVDATPLEFAQTMGYGQTKYANSEAFLKHFNDDFTLELHEALKDMLSKDRLTFGIGSGECEHEIRLFLSGYSIVGSDIVATAFARTTALFPAFRAFEFDIFTPQPVEDFDDLLITGLDFYFHDEEAQQIFINARSLLRSGGRLIFTLRYHDNWVTWAIDYLGIPALCVVWHIRSRLRGEVFNHRLKFHGYRRRRREIVAMATSAGFKLRRVSYAGLGVELSRLGLIHVKSLYSMLAKFDMWLHLFNSATVFEFIL